MIKKAVNSPAPRTGKIGKHSTAQTRNYLYLLLTIFLLWQLFSCLCFPELLQTWHMAEAVLPSKSGVLGRGTSALGKVAMQTESPTSLRGREALPGGVHSSIPSCAAPQTSMTTLQLVNEKAPVLFWGIEWKKKPMRFLFCSFLWISLFVLIWNKFIYFRIRRTQYNDLCFPKEGLISASSFIVVPMHERCPCAWKILPKLLCEVKREFYSMSRLSDRI